MILTRMPNKAPCLDCDRRHIGCHTICTEYKAWRKQQDEIIQQRNKDYLEKPEIPNGFKKLIWKEIKKNGR